MPYALCLMPYAEGLIPLCLRGCPVTNLGISDWITPWSPSMCLVVKSQQKLSNIL